MAHAVLAKRHDATALKCDREPSPARQDRLSSLGELVAEVRGGCRNRAETTARAA